MPVPAPCAYLCYHPKTPLSKVVDGVPCLLRVLLCKTSDGASMSREHPPPHTARPAGHCINSYRGCQARSSDIYRQTTASNRASLILDGVPPLGRTPMRYMSWQGNVRVKGGVGGRASFPPLGGLFFCPAYLEVDVDQQLVFLLLVLAFAEQSRHDGGHPIARSTRTWLTPLHRQQ